MPTRRLAALHVALVSVFLLGTILREERIFHASDNRDFHLEVNQIVKNYEPFDEDDFEIVWPSAIHGVRMPAAAVAGIDKGSRVVVPLEPDHGGLIAPSGLERLTRAKVRELLRAGTPFLTGSVMSKERGQADANVYIRYDAQMLRRVNLTPDDQRFVDGFFARFPRAEGYVAGGTVKLHNHALGLCVTTHRSGRQWISGVDREVSPFRRIRTNLPDAGFIERAFGPVELSASRTEVEAALGRGSFKGADRQSGMLWYVDRKNDVGLTVILDGDGQVSTVSVGRGVSRSPFLSAEAPIDRLATGRGVRLGDSPERIIQLYGEPMEYHRKPDWLEIGYWSEAAAGLDAYRIQFFFEKGRLSRIAFGLGQQRFDRWPAFAHSGL